LRYNLPVQWYETEVRGLEAEIATLRLAQPVVFYGSSTMRMWETLKEDTGSQHVLNVAFGGSTLEACAHFFDRLVVAARPCSLVVYAGDNDLGDGRSPAHVVESYRKMVAKRDAMLPGVALGFISIKSSPSRYQINDRIVETNAAIRALSGQQPKDYYIDVSPHILGPDSKPLAEYFQPDGLHLSPAGYRVWAKAIFKDRDRIFNEDFRKAHQSG